MNDVLSTLAPAGPRAPARRWVALIAGAVALLACADTGVSAGTSGFETGTLVRLAVVLGAALVALWAVRFEHFLLAVLVLRPVLDASKLGGGPSVLASAVAGLVILGVLVWCVAQWLSGALRPVSVLGWVLLALLAAMALSAIFAGDRLRSLLQVARLAAAVAVFLGVEQVAHRLRDRRAVLVACLASAFVPFAVGAWQFATGHYLKESDGLGRVTGTFLHPNAFGFYLVLLLTTGVAVHRHVDARLRWLVSLVLVVGLVEMVLSYSRGSWISLVVGLLVVGVLQARKLLVVVPLVIGAVLLAVPSVITRLSDLTDATTVNGTPGNSFLWRVQHWQVVLAGARGHALLGIGPGEADYLGTTVLPPHNDFVRMYVETGVLGLALYLGAIVVALVLTARAVRSTAPLGLDRGLAVGALACTVAFVVDSAGGNLISEVVVLLYFFALLGLVSAGRREQVLALAAARRAGGGTPPAPQPHRPAVLVGGAQR